jgi:disulfide bond formation protein DsbB
MPIYGIPGPPYPLPEWLEPWALAGFIAVFVVTLLWAIRQPRRR